MKNTIRKIRRIKGRTQCTRFLSVILAVIMTAGTSVPAFAQSNGELPRMFLEDVQNEDLFQKSHSDSPALTSEAIDPGKIVFLSDDVINAGEISACSSGMGDTYGPAKAFDGITDDYDNCWHTDWSGGDTCDKSEQFCHWIEVTFPAPQRISVLGYYPRLMGPYASPQFMQGYRILVKAEENDEFVEAATGSWEYNDDLQTTRYAVFEEQEVKTIRVIFDSNGSDAAVGELSFGVIPDVEDDTTPPEAVTDLQAEVSDEGWVELSWHPSADDSGYSVCYDIYRGMSEDFVPEESNRLVSDLGTANYTDKTVGMSGQYWYQVVARDLAGNAAQPVSVSVKVKGKNNVLIPQTQLTVVGCSTQAAGYEKEKLIDGDPGTMWHSDWLQDLPVKQSVTIDLGEVCLVSALELRNRNDATGSAFPEFNVYVSADNNTYERILIGVTLEEQAAGGLNRVELPIQNARYIKLETSQQLKVASIAELNVYRSLRTDENFLSLNQKVFEIRMLLKSVVIGEEPDQYPQSAADKLEQLLAGAALLLEQEEVSAEEYQNALTGLEQAKQDFLNSKVMYTAAELSNEIAECEQLLAAAVEGTKEGQYPGFAIDELRDAVTAAKAIDLADAAAVHEGYQVLVGMRERFLLSVIADEISLAGRWDFALGEYDGVSHVEEDTIQLPGSTDENKKGFVNTDYTDVDRLSRRYVYLGKAIYQKEFYAPQFWEDKRVTFTMGRTRDTRVWLNGQLVGENDSLGIAQVYDLTGYLKFGNAQGANLLTVEVDNSSYTFTNADVSHMASPETQTNWNGILGDIVLKAQDKLYIDAVRVYPDREEETDEFVNTARMVLNVGNLTEHTLDAEVTVSAVSRNTDKPVQKVMAKTFVNQAVTESGLTELNLSYPLGKDAYLWDEFDPALYDITVTVTAGEYSDSRTVSFGLREFQVASDQRHFQINGKKIFIRGEANCAVFPLTGYAPMTKQEWKEIFRVAKDYGLNAYRFHSWTPPKAAFDAADEMGIYMQPELYALTGVPFDAKTIAYSLEEGERILNELASNPSLVMMALGNEMSDGPAVWGQMIKEFQKYDPSRLYTSGSNTYCYYTDIDYEDFHTDMWFRATSRWAEGFLDTKTPATTYNYAAQLQDIPRPMIAHEIGEFQIYPDYAQIEKYTGVTDPRNLKIFRDNLEANGMLDQNKDFFLASAELGAICYRTEVEAALRTDIQAGFHLLGLQDFPGQGTALVGLVDAFMDPHDEVITGEEFRQWCGPVVALSIMDKMVWTNDETFEAKLQIANYGPSALKGAVPVWKILRQDGTELASGSCTAVDIPQGGLFDVGEISCALDQISQAEQLKLTIGLAGGEVPENRYDLWVYPAEISTEVPADVVVVTSFDKTAEKALAEGKKVLILPAMNQMALPKSVQGYFQASFWTPGFGVQTTVGTLIDEDHPVFENFPTQFYSNWQWWNLFKNSRPIILSDAPEGYKPIIQAIDNVKSNQKLGLLFEGRVGNGKVLICGMDLTKNTKNCPEVQQLYRSILDYMHSDRFAPADELSAELLAELIPAQRGPSGSLSVNESAEGYPMPFASYSLEDGDGKRLWKINDDIIELTDGNNSWTNWQRGEQRSGDYIGIDFGKEVKTDRVGIFVYTDSGCQPPKDFDLQYWDGTDWVSVPDQILEGKEAMTQGENVITFEEVTTSKLRFVMEATEGYALAVSEFQVFGSLTAEITGVTNPAPLKVVKGTGAEELQLPESLTVQLTDGTETEVPVQWDYTSYQADVAGTYEICGVLEVPDWLANSAQIKAAASVTVFEQHSFEDVAPGSWYEEAVNNVYDKGIMTGIDETQTIFEPGAVLNRAQFAVILWRMAGSPDMEYIKEFADVPEDLWYTDAVLWASKQGIVTGYADTDLFGPADSISRGQMAVMLYRYAKSKGYDVSKTAELDFYKDASDVPEYAKEAMQWAAGSGIILGREDGIFLDPQGDTLRCECAVMLTRALQIFEN